MTRSREDHRRGRQVCLRRCHPSHRHHGRRLRGRHTPAAAKPAPATPAATPTLRPYQLSTLRARLAGAGEAT